MNKCGGGGIMMSLFSSRLNAHILILIQLVVLKCQLNKCKFGNVFFIITLNPTCNFHPYDRSYRQPFNIQNADWKGRGNQYFQFVRVLYCKLPTNGKQLPAFPREAVPGTEPRPQRWEARVLPLCHRGPA